MFKKLMGVSCLSTCFLGACGDLSPESTDASVKIVNGEIPAATQNDERVFSTVAITDPIRAREGHSWCSGTLISKRVLVTAGHCVGSTAWVSFDRVVSDKGLIKVTKQVRHPKFSSQKSALINDVALFILESDAPNTSAPAKVFSGELPLETVVAVAGYGVTRFRGKDDTGTLRQANVFVKSVAQKPTAEIVLAGKNGEDTCQGDSGGPAYVKVDTHYEVVGATSWGNGCGVEGHYTDLRAHTDFIKETLASVGQ